ncbi:MAG: class IV adenylate cyclase [Acidobacteria bacterium]|nr:class IV adenylate cyclase [Acidobacteriota bacterium]
MPRNVEVKARLTDVASVCRKARALATDGPHEFVQHDVFFHCRRGRLKLRRFADGAGELIAYERADEAGPKTSHYRVVPCADPDAVAEALGNALGVLGEVRKRRTLFLIGRTRVHLDEVEDLGSFLELEVVLGVGEPAAAGEAEIAALMTALGVESACLISGAYVDLLIDDRA